MRRPSPRVPDDPKHSRRSAGIAPLLLIAVAISFSSARGVGGRAETAQVPPGLDQLVREYPAQVQAALRSLGTGVQEFDKERFSGALQDLPDEATAAVTLVGDYALFYRARTNLALDQAEASARQFRLLRDRYPDSPLYQQAILGEAQALLKKHEPAAALAILQGPKIEDSADIVYARAQALDQLGRKSEALALYFRVYAKYTNSSAASAAEQHLKVLSPSFQSSPKNYATMLERADNIVRAGRNREARALLLSLAKVAPPDAASGVRRRVLWAQVEYNLGRGATLIPLLEKAGAVDTPARAQSIYILGLCYRRAKKESSFFAARDRLISLYPQSPFTERLLYSVAGYLDIDNRLDEAGRTFAQVAERFPRGEYAERALWRSCLIHYFQKRYEEALRGFWRYHAAYPDQRYTAPVLYWIGRCCERLGDGAGAAYLYARCRAFAADNYYGQRARESEQSLRQSGPNPGRPSAAIDFAQVRLWADGLGRQDPSIPEPAKASEALLDRARQLLAADLPDLALSELRSGLRRYPGERAIPYVISRVSERNGEFYGVFRNLRRVFPDYDARPLSALPHGVWEMLYPMRHDRVISGEAAKYKVDPSLVRAIIRQESAFVEDARSSANARGLMQVLPSTGRGLARGAGIGRYTVQKLYRPEVNIALGTRFLAGLLIEYDNKLEVALAAYNAGTDRAEKWVREYSFSDMAEFVERIPFAETRDYVKQVLTNTAYYRLVAGATNAASR